jgi:hypothetical protein
MDGFDIFSASQIGTKHRERRINNQDVVEVFDSNDLAIAMICDGCGSSERSEFGSLYAARFYVEQLGGLVYPMRQQESIPWQDLLDRVQVDLGSYLRVFMKPLGRSFSKLVDRYLLFTVLGLVMTPNETMFFSVGDGVYAANDEVTIIEPMDGNKPIYLAYGLLANSTDDIPQDQLGVKVRHIVRTSELTSGLIGSDGACQLKRVADRTIPNSDEPIGDIDQFWKGFENSIDLEMRLAQIGEPMMTNQDGKIRRYPGLLPDDTSLVVVRRKQAQESEV